MITKENECERIRDSFVIHSQFYNIISALPDNDRLALYDAISKFGLYGIEPDFGDAFKQAIFAIIKEKMKTSLRRRDACVTNGKKGGRPKKNKNAANKTEEKDR